MLSAKQINNKVIIEISDDGRGINIEKIKEKALKKGFLTQAEIESMTDEQLMNLVFAPGFSTGDEITNISGRGIGLDVVQSKILQLNGKVKLLSELNKGCCIQIKLPTTMSIIKAFIISCQNQNFAIPIEYINTVLRRNTEEVIFNNHKKSIIFEGDTIPLFYLSEILNLNNNDVKTGKLTLILIEIDNKKIALCIDKILGEQEILNKKLSAPLYKLKNISGITTLISGETCLILNMADIIKNTANIVQKALPTKKKGNNSFKILLVDDSKTTRTLEKNILTKLGYSVNLAENPIEAFEKMNKEKYDLIISDIEMPEMNGLEFLEKIKSNEMFNEIPVITVSSISNEEYRKKAFELGAAKYIIKNDFNQNDFEQTIDKILKNNE